MGVRPRIGALALVACVRGPSGAPVTPIDIGHANAKAPLGDVPAAKGACLIKDRASTLDLKVQAGDEKFDLRIVDLPTESEIDRDGNAVVHVRSDISFDGHLVLAKDADSSERSLHTANEVVVLLDGLVKLKDPAILKPRRDDDTAIGLAIVGGLEGEDPHALCGQGLPSVRRGR